MQYPRSPKLRQRIPSLTGFYAAPKVSRARRSSRMAVGTSSKLSAEMAHFACFWACDMAASSAVKFTTTGWEARLDPLVAVGAVLELPKFVGGGTTGRETLAVGGGILVKFGFVGGDVGGGTKAAVGEGLGAKVGGPDGACVGGWKDEAAGGGVGVQV